MGQLVVMVMRPKGSRAPRVRQVFLIRPEAYSAGCSAGAAEKSWFLAWLQVIILDDRGSQATFFFFIFFYFNALPATMHPPEYSPGIYNCLVRWIQHRSPVNSCSTISPCGSEDNMTIWSQQCVCECSLSSDVARSGSVPTWSGQAWSCWVYYSSECFWSWIKPGMERCTVACTSSLWPRLFPI